MHCAGRGLILANRFRFAQLRSQCFIDASHSVIVHILNTNFFHHRYGMVQVEQIEFF